MEHNIGYTVQIWKEGKQYVAHALPLDVASCGSSPEKARSALDEAVDLFLKTSIDMGTLEVVLEECGYEWRDGQWQSPDWLAVEKHSAKVMM